MTETAQQHFFFYQFSAVLVIYQAETVPQETEKVFFMIIRTSPFQDYHPDVAYSVSRSATMSVSLYSLWKWCIRSRARISPETRYKQRQHLSLRWLIYQWEMEWKSERDKWFKLFFLGENPSTHDFLPVFLSVGQGGAFAAAVAHFSRVSVPVVSTVLFSS